MKQMRRSAQALPMEECLEILDKATHGVFALNGEDAPYAVPVSFARSGNVLYFHSSPFGTKIEAMEMTPRASFCVVGRDQTVPELFGTDYLSVIAVGDLQFVEDEAEKRLALEAIGAKYCPGQKGTQAEIEKYLSSVRIIKLKLNEVTGKMALESVRKAGEEHRKKNH